MSAADGTSNIKNKNSRCGICGSDLHTIESVGDLWTCPCVVGHEIVGEVTLAGPDVKIRNRVGVGVDDLAWVLTYNDKYKKNGATSDRGHPDYDSVKPDKRVGVEDVNGLGHKFAHAMGVDAVMALFSLTKKEQKMADSASRVATSAWIPQDVMRSSRALKAAHTPVQANRNLRLNAAKSDHTYNFEKRMLPLKVMGQPVAVELSQREAAALQKLLFAKGRGRHKLGTKRIRI
ncbi:unnamed protein product [Peronospora effusa]|nr:unnamed protein product [Peronospora effusa]